MTSLEEFTENEVITVKRTRRASLDKGRFSKAKADPVGRKQNLLEQGKLPRDKGSRRSDLIRAISDSWGEEIDMVSGMDDMDYDDTELYDVDR